MSFIAPHELQRELPEFQSSLSASRLTHAALIAVEIAVFSVATAGAAYGVAVLGVLGLSTVF